MWIAAFLFEDVKGLTNFENLMINIYFYIEVNLNY